MPLLEKHLVVKRSGIPGSGKGLYTKVDIPKGTRVVEYKGKITSWKDADHADGLNGYLFRVKRYHTIDARPTLQHLARYANDAKGFQKVPGFKNNCIYTIDGLRVFIETTRDIPAGTELLVDYGRDYWTVLKKNLKRHEKEAAAAASKKK